MQDLRTVNEICDFTWEVTAFIETLPGKRPLWLRLYLGSDHFAWDFTWEATIQIGQSTAPGPVAPPSSCFSAWDSRLGKMVGMRHTNSAMSTATAQPAFIHVGFFRNNKNLKRD